MLTVQIPAEITFLSYLEQLRKLHWHAGQQPDNLCGPYWVALLLNTFGGLSVSAVEVAISASTVVPSQGNPAEWLPPGAASRLGKGYERIPATTDIDASGTSIAGLIRATETLSEECFCLVPVQTSDWETGLQTIWELCQSHPEWQMVPLLNAHTSYLWGSRPSHSDLQSYLDGHPIVPSPPDWGVGHFALMVGRLQGEAKNLYAVLDTYPHFGWDGLHLQPPSAIAQSLLRLNHSFEGGVAVFVAQEARSQVESRLTDLGFTIAPWNNGSPMPSLR